MSTHTNDIRWRLAIVAIVFAVVGCAVSVNAPRKALIRPSVVTRPAVAAAAPAAAVVPGPRFPHAVHKELGIECADCHEMDDATGEMAQPTLEFCLDCHEDLQDEEETPEGKRIQDVFFDENEKPKWRKALRANHPDVRFPHGAHAKAVGDCMVCHADVLKTERRLGAPMFTKPECLQCHQERGVSDACATCHIAIRAEVAPPNHEHGWERGHGRAVYVAQQGGTKASCHYCHQNPSYCNDCHQNQLPSSHRCDWERRHGQVVWQAGGPMEARCTFCHEDSNYCDGCHQNRLPTSHKHLWIRRHGVLARAGDMSGMTRCAFCHHEPAFCEDCHRDMEPRDHTALFRTRTHGMVASMDRDRCKVCHEGDFCVRCHESTPPRSHRGMWARGRNTHCIGCHYPIQQTQCFLCHKDNPTHDTAPPLPNWHNPGMTCRGCHNAVGGGGAQPLRHIDNGQPCQSCHN